MVTNDMRPLATPGAGPVYAALVNPKGKLLHDIFVFRASGDAPDQPSSSSAAGASNAAPSTTTTSSSSTSSSAAPSSPPQRLLLDVDAAGAQAVLQYLARYRLRRPIVLADASADFSVWARYSGSSGSGSGSGSGSSSSSGSGSAGWWSDPRLVNDQLGERGVFAHSGLPSTSGWEESRLVDEALHRVLRYQHGVAEGDAEMPTGAVRVRMRMRVFCMWIRVF